MAFMCDNLSLLIVKYIFCLIFQENVDCDFEFVTSSPAAMVSLIDKPAQQLLVNTSPINDHYDI